MHQHRTSNETVAGHVRADNLQPPDAIDVRITGPSAVVLSFALAVLLTRIRKGPTGRRRARLPRRAEGRLRIAT
ncbi:hypothetical protein [Sorangium sp. So ce693]|uniref:hypothetical protein n=1 Tax=Sorangium sp. So ce693 TaxID=3133318 RepID=UPI003F629C6B